MKTYGMSFETKFDQFFIADKAYPEDIYNDAWLRGNETERMAAFDRNFIVIGTDSFRPVNAELKVLKTPSHNTDFTFYDHVVEGSVITNAGGFRIVPCLYLSGGIVAEITLPKGSYRLRVYSAYQNSLGENVVNSFYKIEMWQAPYEEIRLLKPFISYHKS